MWRRVTIPIVIASKGFGSLHSLPPYDASDSFEEFAQRYIDGGYGPVDDLSALGENIAPNNRSNVLARFAAFMIDWDYTPDGVQDQDPATGSHRLSIMNDLFTEVGFPASWVGSGQYERNPGIWGTVLAPRLSDRGGLSGTGQEWVLHRGLRGGRGNITATPVGGGAAKQTISYGSGGCALELNTPGNYTVTVSGSFGAISLGTIAIGAQSVLRDVVVSGGKLNVRIESWQNWSTLLDVLPRPLGTWQLTAPQIVT